MVNDQARWRRRYRRPDANACQQEKDLLVTAQPPGEHGPRPWRQRHRQHRRRGQHPAQSPVVRRTPPVADRRRLYQREHPRVAPASIATAITSTVGRVSPRATRPPQRLLPGRSRCGSARWSPPQAGRIPGGHSSGPLPPARAPARRWTWTGRVRSAAAEFTTTAYTANSARLSATASRTKVWLRAIAHDRVPLARCRRARWRQATHRRGRTGGPES